MIKPSVAMKSAAAARAPKYAYDLRPPELLPGVVPEGKRSPIAQDSALVWVQSQGAFAGFPGFSHLAQLSTRAEYRAMASALSTELTRQWIEFDGDSVKVEAIEAEFKRLNVRETIRQTAEHDCYFGRGQIGIVLDGHQQIDPLILSPKVVRKGSLKRIVPVQATWTTPSEYNSVDPLAPDFYKPLRWFMLGTEIHSTRLLTVITRPLPDILKPAFSFAGMSLSQLAEPYVDNWLRTRQSVSDLLNNFSITALATQMSAVLQGSDDGDDVVARAQLFAATRSNQGLMLLDKEQEELVQLNVPLSGLDKLQAQAQEHLCSVSRLPAIVLTGISPAGLNASSEGELRVFYDWLNGQQEAFWRAPLEVILDLVQLNLFGVIDPTIKLKFKPLYQLTELELAELRNKDAQTDSTYISAGVVNAEEVRTKLSADPVSNYDDLDPAALPEAPQDYSIEPEPDAEPDPTDG